MKLISDSQAIQENPLDRRINISLAISVVIRMTFHTLSSSPPPFKNPSEISLKMAFGLLRAHQRYRHLVTGQVLAKHSQPLQIDQLSLAL